MIHGEIIATIFDSAMVCALFVIGIVAVTVAIDVRYLASTVTGRFAMVRGRTESAKIHPLRV